MIATEIGAGDGLGNQLFRYITLRCMALDHGMDWGIVGSETMANNMHSSCGLYFMDLDDHIKQFGALADKSRIIVNLKIQMDGIGMGIALLIDGFILLRGLITKLIKRFIGHHNHLTVKLAYLK